MPRITYNKNTNTFTLTASVFSLFKEKKMERYTLQHLSWMNSADKLILSVIDPASALKILLEKTNNYDEFIADINNYIMSFLNGEGLTQNAKISFEKIQLADKLAGIFRGKADNGMMSVELQEKGNNQSKAPISDELKLKADIEEIYKKALKLDPMRINGRDYPNGRLGGILISLRCKTDPRFKGCYERHVKAQDLPIQFYRSYG